MTLQVLLFLLVCILFLGLALFWHLDWLPLSLPIHEQGPGTLQSNGSSSHAPT